MAVFCTELVAKDAVLVGDELCSPPDYEVASRIGQIENEQAVLGTRKKVLHSLAASESHECSSPWSQRNQIVVV